MISLIAIKMFLICAKWEGVPKACDFETPIYLTKFDLGMSIKLGAMLAAYLLFINWTLHTPVKGQMGWIVRSFQYT